MRRFLFLCLLVCILAASACSSKISKSNAQPETPIQDTIIELIHIEMDSFEKEHENEAIGKELNMAYDGMARYKGTYFVDLDERQSLILPASHHKLEDHIYIVEPDEGVLDYELEIRDSYDNELLAVTAEDTDNPTKILVFVGPEHIVVISPVFVIKEIRTENPGSSYKFKIHRYDFDYYDLVELPDDHRKSLREQGFTFEEVKLSSCSQGRTCETTFVIFKQNQYAVDIIGPPAISDIDISIWCNDPETLIGSSEPSPENRSNICYTDIVLDQLGTGEIRYRINKNESNLLYHPILIYIFKKKVE